MTGRAAAGTLDVEGSLTSAVSVDSGATLVGTGSTGGLSVASGGLVSPGGDTIGTLTVNGNVNLPAGSKYQVNANDTGSSDLISATGTAALGGGSVIAVEAGSNWNATSRYTILAANAATPTMRRHSRARAVNADVILIDHGVTPIAERNDATHEISTGAAVQALGASNAIYNAVLPLAAGPARASFANLAGDSLASTRTAIIDDSHYVRDAINSHLQGVQGAGEITQNDQQGRRSGEHVLQTAGKSADPAHPAAPRTVAQHRAAGGPGMRTNAGKSPVSAAVGGAAASRPTNGAARSLATPTRTAPTRPAPWRAFRSKSATHSWYETRSHRQIDVPTLGGFATASYNNGVTQAYVDGGYQFMNKIELA
ncbi:MAG: hypothetical protein WDW38_003486 [Sanguina aurantia]